MYQHKASKKQLDYLDYLCGELRMINRYKYQYCNVNMASKEIDRLQKKLAKARLPVQLSLV